MKVHIKQNWYREFGTHRIHKVNGIKHVLWITCWSLFMVYGGTHWQYMV